MGIHDFTFYNVIKRNSIFFGGRAAWFEVDEYRILTFGQYK